MAKTANRPRHSKNDLLDRGLEILVESGPDGLTIDRLCKGLGVTKGSFYHHFKNRKSFVRQLLQHWLDQNTISIIDCTEEADDAASRYARIKAIADNLPLEPDATIRAWAMRDPLVRKFQEQADLLRMNYLKELFFPYAQNINQAIRMARIAYTTYIGSRFIMPPLEEEAMQEIRDEIRKFFNIPEPEKPERKK